MNLEKPAPQDAHRAARRSALRRWLATPVVLGAILFGAAGTLAYWQAWVYIATIWLAVGGMGGYLALKDPSFLARRMRMREKEATERRLLVVAIPVYLALFIVPALDRRFGWSAPPAWAALGADAVMLVAYAFICWVFYENRFAGRTIQIEDQQRVIDSGPYRIVRHPMYLGVVVMFGMTPLALGSCWGLLATVPLPIVLIVRILDEERLLRRELPGYEEYARRTRFRLVPGIW